jgi:hypothetical protein
VDHVRNLDDVLEKEWQQQVVALLRTLGYRCYHTHDSRRSQPGFPDLVAIRDRVIYLELKREKGTLTAKQVEWLSGLAKAGAEVYVVRPRHFDHLAAALGPRGTMKWKVALDVLYAELDNVGVAA